MAAPLNAEPASSEERAKAHLPPKSYAAVVEDEAPIDENKVNSGIDDAEGNSATNNTDNKDSKPTVQKAAVLRIVDTGAPTPEKKETGRPSVERQESQSEYTAAVDKRIPSAFTSS